MSETNPPRSPETPSRLSRRDFLGSALVVGAILPQRFDQDYPLRTTNDRDQAFAHYSRIVMEKKDHQMLDF